MPRAFAPPVPARSAALALALLAVALGAAACSGRYIETPAPQDPQHRQSPHIVVGSAPVDTRDHRFFDVKRVYVRMGDRVVAADAHDGVDRYDQDRVGLSGIPIAGGLFGARLSDADFKPAHRVGRVFASAGTMQVVFDVLPTTAPAQAVVVNRDYAWVFPPLRPAHPPEAEAGGGAAPVGEAYMPRPGVLLLLVRPSIITDSLL